MLRWKLPGGHRGFAASLSLLVYLQQLYSIVVELPVSSTHERWKLQWDTFNQSAVDFVAEVRKTVGGAGVTWHVNVDGPIAVAHRGAGFLSLEDAWPDGIFVPWSELPGRLHSVVAEARPDIALEVEEAPYVLSRPRPKPHAGVFMLKSPGGNFWRLFGWTLRYTFALGHLPWVRLHILVHSVLDWQPQAWLESLGNVAEMFAGMHWCHGPNRYAGFNPQLVHAKPTDNYYHKVFVMLASARRNDYKYIVSFDDDVLLAPSGLGALLGSGALAENSGCGIVLPLLQNGIPSVEQWIQTWLNKEEAEELYKCFSESSGRFCDLQCCKDPEPGRYVEFDVPSPWAPVDWYKQVADRMDIAHRHFHPIRGNLTCMELALKFALQHVNEYWLESHTHKLWKDDTGIYSYLCNNAFLMSTDRYQEVIAHKDLRFGGTDEVTVNRVLEDNNLPICFLGNSFGIHPAWGSFGQDVKARMVALAQRALYSYFLEVDAYTLKEYGRKP